MTLCASAHKWITCDSQNVYMWFVHFVFKIYLANNDIGCVFTFLGFWQSSIYKQVRTLVFLQYNFIFSIVYIQLVCVLFTNIGFAFYLFLLSIVYIELVCLILIIFGLIFFLLHIIIVYIQLVCLLLINYGFLFNLCNIIIVYIQLDCLLQIQSYYPSF